MSKRQALGVISTNSNNTLKQAANTNNINNNPKLKNSTSYTSFNNNNNNNNNNNQLKPNITSSTSHNQLLNQLQFNDENEPPQYVLASLNKNEFDFEIFQEKSSKLNKQSPRKKRDEDEEDQEEENENEDNYEQENYDQHESEQEELEEEEEGISRLNIAALVEQTSDEFKSQINTSSNELMICMDSSSSTHNDSPMVLDDTIKFQSILSKLSEDEDCDLVRGEYDDDDDEETRRKIAAHERENILMNCLEYKDDILKYMRKLELDNRPKSNYMKKQLDITPSMRSILVDWLVEVSEEYKLNIETLYLAVNYTDRFLSQMSVLRGKLQLVGTASMYIASKYEEITPPDVNEFVYITDDTYTKKQVLRMEHLLLKVLDFKMSPPTINWFLMHYLRFIKLNTSLNNPNNTDLYNRMENLARYLAELTLIDAETYLAYLPSQIAASAIYLALVTLNKSWTKQIADLCGYNHDLSELKACILDMYKTMQQAQTHPQQAIQEKYKQAKYDHVSLIEPLKQLPANFN